MTDERLFERLAAHAGPADVDPAFEDRLYTVLQQEMRQSRRTLRPALLLVAALLLALAMGAAALVLSGIVEPPVPPDSLMTWTRVAIDERSLAVLDPNALDFSQNTRVAWLGDRFVLVDELRGAKAVSTSTDGRAWELLDENDPDWDSYSLVSASSAIATWEHDTVLWTSGVYTSGLSILSPPDEPVTNPDFSGGVGAAGIGPAGIVAHVHSALDFDAFVTSQLGPGWVEHMVTFSFQDGILRITTNDDRALEIVWAEQGFEPGDVADRGFGWYSPNGDQWRAIPDFPANVSEIVGVSDGFFARGGQVRCDGCADPTDPFGMWHSPDGLTWRQIGPVATDGSVLPWREGVLVTDGARRFDVWTAEGSSELPMAVELPAGWGASSHAIESGSLAVGSGSLGLVLVNIDHHEVLVTPNGVDWSIQPMSTEMAAAAGLSRTRSITNVAVGTDSAVVLLWAGEPESAVPSLWVGTLEP